MAKFLLAGVAAGVTKSQRLGIEMLRIAFVRHFLSDRPELADTRAALLAAYGVYRAIPDNPGSSLAARSPDGELVVTLWESHAETYNGQWITFSGSLEQWHGVGIAGFRECIQEAFLSDRPLRLVIARTADALVKGAAPDAGSLGTTFHPKPGWRGRVLSFDGDGYFISFCRIAADCPGGHARRRADKWQPQPAPFADAVEDEWRAV